MINALRILDDVSSRATWSIHTSLMADLEEAKQARREWQPNHLVASLESAAVTLAERTYLDLFRRLHDGPDRGQFRL